MAEVYVTKEAQRYSENLISQWLRDSGYDGSLEDGTSLYDVVIRPSSLIYTLFRQNIDKAYAYMSLSKALDLRSTLSEEDYDAAIDGILSNWFVSRNPGGKTTGTVRLYFSRPLDFISFTDGEYIGSYDTIRFKARIYDIYSADAKAFNVADFTSVMDTSGNITEYYIDVPVISEENTDISIPEGAVFTVSAPDVYFLRGTAAADFISGQARETSDAFIARTRDAITTRELITRRAFHTVLPDQFPDMRSLYVSGCGDSEMIRDIKNFPYTHVVEDVPTTIYTPVHVGNKADLWVGSELQRTEEICEVHSEVQNEETVHYIELKNSPVHIMGITDNAKNYYIDQDASDVIDENHWHFAMEEIAGIDDKLEERWFVPGEDLGKIYLEDLEPIDSEEHEEATDEVVVALVHNAPYNKITEGNTLTYKVKLNQRLEDNAVVTIRDDTHPIVTLFHDVHEDEPITKGENISFLIALNKPVENDVVITIESNQPIPTNSVTMAAGQTLCLAADIPTDTLEPGDSVWMRIVSVDFPGVSSNDVIVVQPAGPVVVTDEAGHFPTAGYPSSIKTISVEIPAGQKESAPIEIVTRANDVYYDSDDVIDLTIENFSVPGEEFENLVIANPDPVVVTDEEDYTPQDDEEEEESSGDEPFVRTVTVHEITSDVARNIQEFITNDTNRVASFDPKVKMKVPVVLRFGAKDTDDPSDDTKKFIISTNVNYVNRDSSNYDKEAKKALIAEIKRAIREYVDSTNVYVESEMVQYVHNNVPMVSVVHLPVPTEATFMNMKTGRHVHLNVRNEFSLDGVELSKQITTNTIQYYTNDDLINIELR